MTVHELNELFGKNVKYYRRKKGLKSKELAHELGVTGNAVSDWETGRHMADGKQLVLLAYVLGVDVWKLFYEEGKP